MTVRPRTMSRFLRAKLARRLTSFSPPRRKTPVSLPPRCDREIRTFTDIYSFETSLFLRLWVSRLLSKLRRLPAVRYLHSTHCDIDLIVIEGIALSVCGSVCLKDTRICWVLGAFGFLH